MDISYRNRPKSPLASLNHNKTRRAMSADADGVRRKSGNTSKSKLDLAEEFQIELDEVKAIKKMIIDKYKAQFREKYKDFYEAKREDLQTTGNSQDLWCPQVRSDSPVSQANLDSAFNESEHFPRDEEQKYDMYAAQYAVCGFTPSGNMYSREYFSQEPDSRELEKKAERTIDMKLDPGSPQAYMHSNNYGSPKGPLIAAASIPIEFPSSSGMVEDPNRFVESKHAVEGDETEGREYHTQYYEEEMAEPIPSPIQHASQPAVEVEGKNEADEEEIASDVELAKTEDKDEGSVESVEEIPEIPAKRTPPAHSKPVRSKYQLSDSDSDEELSQIVVTTTKPAVPKESTHDESIEEIPQIPMGRPSPQKKMPNARSSAIKSGKYDLSDSESETSASFSVVAIEKQKASTKPASRNLNTTSKPQVSPSTVDKRISVSENSKPKKQKDNGFADLLNLAEKTKTTQDGNISDSSDSSKDEKPIPLSGTRKSNAGQASPIKKKTHDPVKMTSPIVRRPAYQLEVADVEEIEL